MHNKWRAWLYFFDYCVLKTLKPLAKAWMMSVLHHWFWTLYMFRNRWWLFALLTNNYFCLLQCFCVKKYAILCVFCDFDTLSYFVANSACRTKQKIAKTRQQLFCFTQELPKVTRNGIAVTTVSIMWHFVFRMFCTLLPVSCAHVDHTKNTHTQNQ